MHVAGAEGHLHHFQNAVCVCEQTMLIYASGAL